MFLGYLSQVLHAPFLCTCLTLRRLFSGEFVMANMYKRNVLEALEINKLKTLNETDKTFKVLNRDDGD